MGTRKARQKTRPKNVDTGSIDRRLDIERFLQHVGVLDRTNLETVSIAEIIDDDRFQSRFIKIDHDALAGMRDIFTSYDVIPPVIVGEFDGKLYALDGRHRIFIATEKNWVRLWAYVIRNATCEELRVVTLLANGINGRTPNMGERRHHLREMIQLGKDSGMTEAAAIETYAPGLGIKVSTARNWVRVQKTVERLARLKLKLPVHRVVPDEALRTIYQTTQDSWILAVSKLKDEELDPRYWDVWSKLDVKKITKIGKQLSDCQSVTERIDLAEHLWREYQGPASIAGQRRDRERDQISTAVASCGNLLKLGEALTGMARESPRLRDKLVELSMLLARIIPLKSVAA